MALIVFWKGSPVNVIRTIGDSYEIGIAYPYQVTRIITVPKSETTPCQPPIPLLKPWMITVLQRLVIQEKEKLIFTKDAKKQIKAIGLEKGREHADALAEQFLNAAQKDMQNSLTDLGKMHSIIQTLDDIAKAYLDEMKK